MLLVGVEDSAVNQPMGGSKDNGPCYGKRGDADVGVGNDTSGDSGSSAGVRTGNKQRATARVVDL